MSVKLDEEEKVPKNERNKLSEKDQYLSKKIANNIDNTMKFSKNLEEVGYVGLLNAINLYDDNIHKMNFETHAQIPITQEMHQCLSNLNRKIDGPDWLIQLNRKIDQFVTEYRQIHQKYPKIADIANHLHRECPGLFELLKTRNSLKTSYSAHRKDIDLFQIQPESQKIGNQSYQSLKLPVEGIIALKKAFPKLKKLWENKIYYLCVMDLNQTKIARMLGIYREKANQM